MTLGCTLVNQNSLRLGTAQALVVKTSIRSVHRMKRFLEPDQIKHQSRDRWCPTGNLFQGSSLS